MGHLLVSISTMEHYFLVSFLIKWVLQRYFCHFRVGVVLCFAEGTTELCRLEWGWIEHFLFFKGLCVESLETLTGTCTSFNYSADMKAKVARRAIAINERVVKVLSWLSTVFYRTQEGSATWQNRFRFQPGICSNPYKAYSAIKHRIAITKLSLGGPLLKPHYDWGRNCQWRGMKCLCTSRIFEIGLYLVKTQTT